jgi:hypothetical protein
MTVHYFVNEIFLFITLRNYNSPYGEPIIIITVVSRRDSDLPVSEGAKTALGL